ncbi:MULTISPECIES: GIY-YIG nuclease family protein [unclassified Lactobacillus]|uniref:GIY-YIG nuclease family protein n=1 Tax=unclassified Lactobacillus TaxID=2620435 RepID=UPI000EFC397A|nr:MULTISPECIES: GIY-YIG nuclease family protein [unclassified Lactobacillus]RMC24505.1 methyltransferase [Lactobacillus sp. ESL0247]RMC28644.1 methyltransferase [Lactobacillus sp. ESL0246]RMC31836.1 methyltransferase [Lactobacillus sp. ESL0245]
MINLKKNERIDYMYSDHLKIIQDKTSFSFSLDTLLLASMAKNSIKDNFKVADLCAGNCAATIYMAYFNRAKYDAIEIQEDIVSQAERSVTLNQMENRIKVYSENVKDATTFLRKDYYDVIVVNPPYFKVVKDHKINPDAKKAIARHELLINLEEIINVSSMLLKMKGKMFMVHRPERLNEIAYCCLKHDLSIKLIQPYVSHRGENSNLIIIEAVKHTSSDGLVLKDPIEVHNQSGDYQPVIQRIIRESDTEKRSRADRKEYYFYVLLCSDGSFYGGFTDNLKKRLQTHNDGKGAKYTKARRPVKMIYHEKFADKKLALKREYWFKHHSRQWKEAFLKEHRVDF